MDVTSLKKTLTNCSEDIVVIPIDGTLDLHTFRPEDIKYLIPDYIYECRKSGITQVRIIHGKGTGTLRRTVHAVLSRMSEVKSFTLADEQRGSWGATIVQLSI
ncbi:MAG TPA: DNA mismatch repair protein MutS [Thermodesulfobacteriaceae bacterium]|nr:DNA mismatch repair protein MutS [Thermodesulfobacteriaceae bacterium]